MTPLYDVCFAGEILDNQDITLVRARLAKLFKADEATLDRLFSGKLQLLKRACDRDTALKYKQAIEQAGARPLIRSAAKSAGAAPAPAAEPPSTLTAAERIARLAAAPDVTDSAAGNNDHGEPPQEAEGGISLSPPGADVLRPEERLPEVAADIDISAIELFETGAQLSEPGATPPPAPDTGHLTLGAAGEIIPTLASAESPVSPDTSAITLSPEDSGFADCAPPPASAPAIDLSRLDLAPSGADMLEESYRRKPEGPAPSTDHLELDH